MAGEQFKGNPEKQIREYNQGDFQNTDPVTGEARELPEDRTAQAIEQIHNPNDPAARGTDASEDADYDSMTVEELRTEAGDLDVRRRGGGEGAPVKADYIRALRKRDRA